MEGPVAFPYKNYPAPEVTLEMHKAALTEWLRFRPEDRFADMVIDLYRAMRLYRPLSEGPEP